MHLGWSFALNGRWCRTPMTQTILLALVYIFGVARPSMPEQISLPPPESSQHSSPRLWTGRYKLAEGASWTRALVGLCNSNDITKSKETPGPFEVSSPHQISLPRKPPSLRPKNDEAWCCLPILHTHLSENRVRRSRLGLSLTSLWIMKPSTEHDWAICPISSSVPSIKGSATMRP